MVAQNVFHRASSHQILNLWRFADRSNIPKNLPTNFRFDPIATIQQRYLLLLCALLFQQYHWSPICAVQTSNDSKWDLDELCRIPRNCQCKLLLVSSRVPRTYASFSGFLVKVFFLYGYAWIHWVARSCTTTAYRTLFRDSQLSLRTLWSAVIKSPKCSARGTAPPLRLLHGALVILVLLQISQFRYFGKLVFNTVLTQILTSLEYGLQGCFIRRTGVRISMYWNFIIHQNFHEFLQPLWVSQNLHELNRLTTGRPVPSWVPFYLFSGVLLAWVSSGRPDLSSTELDACTGEMSLSIRSPRSWLWISLTVGEEDEVEEGVEEWLSCLEGVFEVDEDARWTWQAWNHNRNEVLRVAGYPNPVCNEMWLLTNDPFIRISVFITTLSKRQYCWRFFEDFHCQEFIQFFDIHICLFSRLPFSIGWLWLS